MMFFTQWNWTIKKYFKNSVYIGNNAGAGMMVGQPDV